MNPTGRSCSNPADFPYVHSSENTLFIRTVMEEERQLKKLHDEEAQSTVENPHVRSQYETEAISTELLAQKRQKFIEDKRRQQLRESNQELRQLLKHLESARITTELLSQKEVREKLRGKVLEAQRRENEQIKAHRLKMEELHRENEALQQCKKQQLRADLRRQMDMKKELRVKEYEELLSEGEAIRKLQACVEEQRIAELALKEQRKLAAKKEIEDHMKAQEHAKKEEQQRKIEEAEYYMQYIKHREEQEKLKKEKKRLEDEQKRALSEKIGLRIHEFGSEKKRREELLIDLLVEEKNAKVNDQYRQMLEQKARERALIQKDLDEYSKNLACYKMIKQKQADNQLIEEEAKVLAKLDKEASEKKQATEQRKLEYRIAIQEMIEVNRVKRVQEIREKLADNKLLVAAECKKEQDIQQERIRLLQSQPAELLSHLPRGVLRESDREFLALPPELQNIAFKRGPEFLFCPKNNAQQTK